MATCTITTVTDPISSVNQTTVTASGTCTASDVVTVTIRDKNGTAVGPIAATEVGTAWSIAATDITALADGTLIFEATSTDGASDEAFAAKAAYKNTTNTLYITLAEFRDYIHDPSVLDSGPANAAISAACRQVDDICGRVFYQTTEARYFSPDGLYCVEIDDLSTTSGLVVKTGADGTGVYTTTLTLNTDFVLEPTNPDPGWPYTSLRGLTALSGFPFRYLGYRDTIEITGTWGWSAVPDPVKQATFVIAAQLYKMGDAPFGNAGFGEFGVMRVREIPIVQQLLGPYSKTAGVVVA